MHGLEYDLCFFSLLLDLQPFRRNNCIGLKMKNERALILEGQQAMGTSSNSTSLNAVSKEESPEEGG